MYHVFQICLKSSPTPGQVLFQVPVAKAEAAGTSWDVGFWFCLVCLEWLLYVTVTVL